jgi:hypothetical protein
VFEHVPPQFASLIPEVRGLFPPIDILLALEAIVPDRRPVAMMSLFFLPSGSQVGSISSVGDFRAEMAASVIVQIRPGLPRDDTGCHVHSK